MGERGTPLTPEQLEHLAELYGECGNASAVARTLGVEVSTVTRALDRLGEQKRAKLQRDALASGLRNAQEHLKVVTDLLGRTLTSELRATTADPIDSDDSDGPGGSEATEPSPATALTNALARSVSTLISLDAREERRQQARLTRKKTRAEIDALERRVTEIPPLDVLRAKLSPEQIVALVRGLTNEQFSAAMAVHAATAPTQPAEVPPAKG